MMIIPNRRRISRTNETSNTTLAYKHLTHSDSTYDDLQYNRICTLAHVASQLTLHGLYLIAVGIDVYSLRQGPVCIASSVCNQTNSTDSKLSIMCDTMDSDLKVMFLIYALAVGATVLKLFTITAMLLSATKSIQSTMVALTSREGRSQSRYVDYHWRECYTVCAAYSLAVAIDTCLMSVSIWRTVALRLQTSSYTNDVFSVSMIENWYVAIPMVAITVLLVAYDSIMFHKSKELCNGI